jgi:hypothetical protein
MRGTSARSYEDGSGSLKSRKLGVAWVLCGLALLASTLLPSAGVFASSGEQGANSSSSDSSDNGNASTRKPRTVPYWSSSFTDPTNRVTYPFTMVGSDPTLGQSTTVDTMIVPLSFTFVAGAQPVSVLDVLAPNYVPTALAATMNGADNVADTIASPIFTPTDFPVSSDTGVQFGDAFARAQFGKVGTYHVILGQPRVAETVSIQVPESEGVAVLSPAPAPANVLVGRVDSSWFKARLAAIIDDMNLKPTTLPIFLTNNVGLYSDGNYLPPFCCSLGGHGAGSPASNAPISLEGKDKIRTFVFAAYLTPNGFSRNPAISDIQALSHEIAEWIDNPFGINVVQPYQIPTPPGAPEACSAALETGDPLVGKAVPVPRNPSASAGLSWHPQDELFLNWFARNGEDQGLAPKPLRYTFAGPMGGPFAAIPLAC